MSAFGSPILTSAFGQKHGGWGRRRPSKARRPCGRTRRSKASESDARSSGDSHRAATPTPTALSSPALPGPPTVFDALATDDSHGNTPGPRFQKQKRVFGR